MLAAAGSSSMAITGISCLVPLPKKVLETVFHSYVFVIVAGFRFNANRSLLALGRSLKLPCALVE